MLLRQAIAASSDNHAKYIIALCGQNAGVFIAKTGDDYTSH